MRDQDRQTGQAKEPSGFKDGRYVTVPAEIVDGLREAAFAAVGKAGEAINEAAFAKGRGENPKWFHGPMTALEELFALLDVLGWTEAGPPVGVEVFLWADGRALMAALEEALGFAEADAGEGVRRAAEQPETAGSAERGAAIERVNVLRELIAVAQPRFDAIERWCAR
jgi:hypothetical protein